MEYRQLGRTGLEVSTLSIGCGGIGGLMVRGEHKEMVYTLARAIELGVNYFDTARIYGDGRSETNLGLVLEELGADVLVGTKVQLTAEDLEGVESGVIDSVEGSLKRLRLDCIDLIQLHNSITMQRQPDQRRVSVGDVQPIIQAFQKLQRQGKVRFWGISGIGESEALHQAVSTYNVDTIQCLFNLINPTAGVQVPEGFPFQDYGRLIDRAAEKQMGVIAFRVLAGGALTGSAARATNASQIVNPIASGQYAEDVEWSQSFNFLVDEGYTSSLVEAAIRFAISKVEVSTALVGISNMEQLEQSVEFANKGPLPAEALGCLSEVWKNYTSA
jgi:aryl-alcohol dehydrogenase-like predicted oxidoreductase